MGLANLPSGSGEKHARAFERLGFRRVRTTSGTNAHIILAKDGFPHLLSIPNHKGRDVKRVLIGKQLKTAGISEAEYIAAYKGK